MKHRRHKAGIAALAALVVPGISLSPVAPAAGAATALFAEGATRQSGEAQTAFGGAFCEQNTCRSLGRGTVTRKLTSAQIQAAVDATPGELILVGYSVGGAGMYDRLREWERNPQLAPDPDRIKLIVTLGNPENKFGGENRNQTDVGLPAVQPYEHLDVVAQYDGVADNPTRFGFYSWVNTAVFSRHFAYFQEDLDVNDPENLVYQEGNTTYMLIPAKTLPMLRWIEPFVTEQRLAELDARYRPLVERDYDRPAYVPQGEGADWGNGNPPPSLADPDDAEILTAANESDSATVLSGPADEPAVKRTSRSAVAPDTDDTDEAPDEVDSDESAEEAEDSAPEDVTPDEDKTADEASDTDSPDSGAADAAA
ncbi:PE-PPE domain-containing protein [Mycolicibacterium sp. BiH015]|uniref:PE-PPE domain-containing protein n=1 Tax=Mycolicibacterium sp. BiH015 TaxID=3018808 RepID=UPI0022E29F15|nr:PE-PPE domain-containing protein [Mycolicibacterium sp. BiH015]MDA2892282.1 PE-PPE domain-containing protein [Mycolicibacterium sp. BiH015]